jgi:hypothetical protein
MFRVPLAGQVSVDSWRKGTPKAAIARGAEAQPLPPPRLRSAPLNAAPSAHLHVLDSRALAPLCHRLGIDAQLPAQLCERSLRLLYCCSDGVRGRGAPVTNLSHSASRHSRERIAPSNRGIKHLAKFTCHQPLLYGNEDLAACQRVEGESLRLRHDLW